MSDYYDIKMRKSLGQPIGVADYNEAIRATENELREAAVSLARSLGEFQSRAPNIMNMTLQEIHEVSGPFIEKGQQCQKVFDDAFRHLVKLIIWKNTEDDDEDDLTSLEIPDSFGGFAEPQPPPGFIDLPSLYDPQDGIDPFGTDEDLPDLPPEQFPF